MPRSHFVADLGRLTNSQLPQGISDVHPGEDDGHVEFCFSAGSVPKVQATAIVLDLSEYPGSHQYMMFVDDNASQFISSALQNLRGTRGKTLPELLDIISATLNKKTETDAGTDSQVDDHSSDEDDFDAEEGSDGGVFDSDHEDYSAHHSTIESSRASDTRSASCGRLADLVFRQRLRADLRAAKEAGFRIGCLGSLLDGLNSFVTVSIRIAKLGISAEATEAWQLQPSEYLILIIQYPNGYRTNEELQSLDSIRLADYLSMRVVTGKKYKPTLQEVLKSFTSVKNDSFPSDIAHSDLSRASEVEKPTARETFISRPMASLLQERLIPILRFRSAGLNWHGAEDWYRQIVNFGRKTDSADAIPDKFFTPEPVNEALPSILHADHYKSDSTLQHSFPLLAMQFLLRHFVRCPEFCLVCHRYLESDLEAIKPYVCDNRLCLYQYMSLGIGPSIEHELSAQPGVVDLLVSFCYQSAAAWKLNEFPDGLGLTVPPISDSVHGRKFPEHSEGDHNGLNSPQPTPMESTKPAEYLVGFDDVKLEITFNIFTNPIIPSALRKGTWTVVSSSAEWGYELHCRVTETAYYPVIFVDSPVKVLLRHSVDGRGIFYVRDALQPALNGHPARLEIYCQDFTKLNPVRKNIAVRRLLDTLPSVTEMNEFLMRQHSSELRNWVERISPAALSLLRWIIASNRACIIQVDGDHCGIELDVGAQDSSQPTSSVLKKEPERCYGMKDYMQFRFAMGAPDKEQRFVNEVRKTTERLNLEYPTLFAFHGSPLYNWHMIIREGLHYNNKAHGRSYGDGVYHAKHAEISSAYSETRSEDNHPARTWPGSILRISSALALNEIVNAPLEFRSSVPFYVVQHLDWIQTRFLFVKVAPTSHTVKIGQEKRPAVPHPQDPSLLVQGTSATIIIPASAIKSSNSDSLSVEHPATIDYDDDDDGSVTTDAEDIEVLIDEAPEAENSIQISKSNEKVNVMKGCFETDFSPGHLDYSTLPIMPLPTYASSATTKRLMKELQNLRKAQEETNFAELGWYIDIEKIENVYQWIVELHSFHMFTADGFPLPLAEDMKNKNVKSVVLEIRFNKDFPFSPPYVRVVRPRFLAFAQGGGGHIVQGGAMCIELLTNTGWSSVSSMESVLMQIRMAIASHPYARLDPVRNSALCGDYGVDEAADGYIRACNVHNWQVPQGFREMAYGMVSNAPR